MDEPSYPFQADDSTFVYHFKSRSASKLIQKVVLITETGRANVFNLALLDELDNGEFSDMSVSNNDDMIPVLATVSKIIADFLNCFPDSSVAFRGSDARRDRLYRMALGRELVKLKQAYDVYGFDGERFISFERNQLYQGFLIRKRQ